MVLLVYKIACVSKVGKKELMDVINGIKCASWLKAEHGEDILKLLNFGSKIYFD